MANQGIQKESLVETKEATTAKQSATAQANEAPENGIKGLKHWRQDMLAGLVVALVSVPLSLGIALASGAPAVCGLTSEIIAGLVFPFLGGAYVTVSGPAAGLAPVLFAAITALGEGDMQKGYHLVVGVIMLVGIVQIVLTKLNAARFCQVLPLSAVHGMLAAIGFLIIGKQIPNLIGHQYKAHEFFAVLAATPGELAHMTPSVFFISCLCLTLLFVLTKFKRGFLGAVPPQLIVVLIGLSLGQLFHLDEKYLVKVPSNPFAYGFVFPDLGALFADPKLIPTVILMVVALTLVDGTESLATMQA
ncbi:MAG TPA: SulP family inorganic anion transporter, partial [Candidatus Obscuribacterales bacterium]